MENSIIAALLLAGLLVEAVFDWKKRKIFVPVVVVEIPALLLLNYRNGNGGIWLLLASFGIGALFYGISLLTGGQIGRGDALLFAMTGAGVGLQDNIVLLYLTFLCAFVAAAVLWIGRRVGKNYKLPLAPFVLLSFCMMYIW